MDYISKRNRRQQRQRQHRLMVSPQVSVTSDLAPTEAETSATVDDPLESPGIGSQRPPRTDGPWAISGVALAAETTPGEGAGLKWTPEALEKIADTLADDSLSQEMIGDGLLVTGHSDDAADAVGEVTFSAYNSETETIDYEAEVYDHELARKVRHGLLEVSPRVMHADTAMMEQTPDGEFIVDADAATRLVHLSLEQSSRSNASTAEPGPLDGDGETFDAAAVRFDPNSARTSSSGTTTTDMSSNTDGGDDAQSGKIADLENKVGQAEQADMQGMVAHYEEQLADLEAGNHPPGEGTDLSPDDEIGIESEAEGETLADLRSKLEQAENARMNGMVAHYEQKIADLEAGGQPSGEGSGRLSDMTAGEAAATVNDLRNKRLTALKRGNADMSRHYEDQIAELVGDGEPVGF